MEFNNKLDTTVWLSRSDSLPFELWHNVASFLVKPKFKNYYVIGDSVLYCTHSVRSKRHTSFYTKEDLERMQHITMSKLKAELIASEILYGLKTIEEVLATYPNF
jgi:hypothetical protein